MNAGQIPAVSIGAARRVPESGLDDEVGRGLRLVPRYRFDQLASTFEGAVLSRVGLPKRVRNQAAHSSWTSATMLVAS